MLHSSRAYRLRLLPLALPVGVLFTAGAAVTLAQSAGFFVPIKMTMETPNATGRLWAWKYLLNDTWIWSSVVYSLLVSFAAAIISVALGSILAWNIHRLPRRWRQAAEIYRIPLVLPHLTVAFLTILLFSRSGIVSGMAHALGWTDSMDSFPNLLYSGNGVGITLAYVMKETPFAILMTLSQLRKLDESTVETARMLGASRFAVFRDIVLPHLRPVMISCYIILFLYELGGFEIPWLIGDTKRQMIGVTAYNLYFHRDLSMRPLAAALLTIMMMLSILSIIITIRITRRRNSHA